MSLETKNSNKWNQDDITGINYLVPNAICKLLSSGAILINLYWSKDQEVQLVGMGVATLFSFVFGYLLIVNLNLCLAYQIGRKRDCPHDVGVYYQRALVINFIICAFIITPLLYISNKIVILFVQIDESLSVIIGQYLFQLVPSIYAFAFYDTTQTFLLAQGHFLAPLVINIFGFFCHFYFIEHLGAAWSKNLTDVGRCFAIYLHLVLRKKKIQSWIQWTIQCFKGWQNHMRIFKSIGLTTYIHTFFFFFFAVVGENLPRAELICHICFINIAQIIFIVNVGLKEGLIIKLGYYIRKRRIKYTRNVGLKSLRIFFIVSIFFVFFMLMYIDQISDFFFTASSTKQIFKQKYWILFFNIVFDSLNMSLATMVKVFNKNHSLVKHQLGFSILSSLMAYFFCYKVGAGLSGLWYGWLFGIILNTIINWMLLVRYQNSHYTVQRGKKQPLMRQIKKQYDEDDF